MKDVFFMKIGIYIRDALIASRGICDFRYLYHDNALFRSKRVLLVAPHYDDEYISSGFILRKIVLLADDLKIIFLSDSAGNRGKAYGARRREESMTFLHSIGVENVCHLEIPDGTIENNYKSVIRLLQHERVNSYDVVICPHYDSYHPDHRNITKILADILSPQKDLLLYCTERSLFPGGINIIFEMDQKSFEKKLCEFQIYRTQYSVFKDLLILNNKIELRFIKRIKYGEPFLLLRSGELKHVLETYRHGNYSSKLRKKGLLSYFKLLRRSKNIHTKQIKIVKL